MPERDLAYFERLQSMSAAELSGSWQEESAEEFSEMRDVLPPARMGGGAFMVGSCLTTGVAGSLYDVHMHLSGRYFWRPAPLRSWDPLVYRSEIRAQFVGNKCMECGWLGPSKDLHRESFPSREVTHVGRDFSITDTLPAGDVAACPECGSLAIDMNVWLDRNSE